MSTQPFLAVPAGIAEPAPIGPASGDLSGSYPAPSVAALQGVAVSPTPPTDAQVLTIVGGVWTPATPAGGGAVSSFNTRTGAVVPASGDYTAAQVTNAVDLTSIQTLTNKTLTSPTLTAPALGTPASGVLDNCTGSPTLTAPALGTPASGVLTNCSGTAAALTAGHVTGLSVTAGKTLSVSNSVTFAGTDATTFTFPSSSDTVVTLAASQTLTNKTLTSPTLTAPVLGTPASGNLTNCTGMLAGIEAAFGAKGQQFVGTGAGTGALYSAGNDGEVPLYDSTTATGFANTRIEPAASYNSLLGWSCDAGLTNSNLVLPAAASRFVMRIPLRRSLVITNLLAAINTTAGSTLTHCFLGIWDSTGAVKGQTADQASVWQSGGSQPTGAYTLAIAGGPVTLAPLQANDWIWVGIYIGTAGGTLPAFFRSATQVAMINIGTSAAAGNLRAGSLTLADTATLTSFVPTNLVAASNLFFVGIS